MAAKEGGESTSSLDSMTDDELRDCVSVLVGSDPDNCSYPKGYVKRQALFACSTCTPNGAEPAGLCLACTNICHDGHDIYDLYTKRNFRCDCGNDKFGGFQCTLIPNKDSQNIRNLYNHNFHGEYCSCDPSQEQDDSEMLQCVVCEDWFHSQHLGCTVDDTVEELQEMVCETCMNKASFLWTYAAHIAAPPVVKVSPCKEEVEVNVEEDDGRMEESLNGDKGTLTSPVSQETEEGKPKDQSAASRKRTHQEMSGIAVETGACRLAELKACGPERTRVGAVFWPYSWRSQLCTCTACKRAYVQVGVQFLLDQSDTLLAYENRGCMEALDKALRSECDELLMSCLASLGLGHVAQLEVIYRYNDMKTDLQALLQRFASENQVVTVEAIREFFEVQKANYRARSEGEDNGV